jgi:hypothetical protein
MLRALLSGWLLSLSAGLSAANETEPVPVAPTITVYITVDWEGWSLDEENLDAMRGFRSRHPQIPMLHLLNPVYFLRPGAEAKKIKAQIDSTLLPIDTQGLHLHGWKLLMQRCEIPYQTAPSFADADEHCPGKECGYTVSLEHAYSTTELTRLIACSSELLVTQGFERPRHFRAGGWQSGPKLAAALQANGFVWDSSSLPPALLEEKWGPDSTMLRLLRQMHPDANILDQPREISPGLMHYPNNAGLMDYTSTAQLLEIFNRLLDAKKPVMVTGFHQETAFVYLDKLEDAIAQMETAAKLAGVKLIWGHYD